MAFSSICAPCLCILHNCVGGRWNSHIVFPKGSHHSMRKYFPSRWINWLLCQLNLSFYWEIMGSMLQWLHSPVAWTRKEWKGLEVQWRKYFVLENIDRMLAIFFSSLTFLCYKRSMRCSTYPCIWYLENILGDDAEYCNIPWLLWQVSAWWYPLHFSHEIVNRHPLQ